MEMTKWSTKHKQNWTKDAERSFSTKKFLFFKRSTMFSTFDINSDRILYWKHTMRYWVCEIVCLFFFHIIVIVVDMNVCLFALLTANVVELRYSTMQSFTCCVYVCVFKLPLNWTVVLCQQTCLGYFTFSKL